MKLLAQSDTKNAISTLKKGGILGVPTETVYGLAVLANNEEAVKKLLDLKERPVNSGKYLTIMLSDVDQMRDFVKVNHRNMSIARHYFPGELTMVLPKADKFKHFYFDNFDKIGIRIPAHDYMLNLIHKSGPLLVTSANPRGEEPCRDAQELKQRMPKIDAAVRGVCGGGLPSTVLDFCSSEPKSLRQGGLLIVHF